MPICIHSNIRGDVFGHNDDVSLETLCLMQKCPPVRVLEICLCRNKNQKEGKVLSNGLFAIVMKECKNKVLYGVHAVAAGDVFCSYLQRALKKPDNKTPKAFKTC